MNFQGQSDKNDLQSDRLIDVR